MIIHKKDSSLRRIHFSIVPLMIFLLLATMACSQDTSNQHAKVHSTSAATQQPLGPYITPVPTLAPQALHGPTNFQLSNPFKFAQATGTSTDNGGTVTQLDAKTIQTSITDELKRFLFVVDRNNTIKVYTPGASAPISTQVTQQADGDTSIQYTQIVDSVTTTFNSAMARDRITIEYERQYSGEASDNDPLAMTGSDVNVALTTTVKWVTAKEIPTAPTRGSFHLTNAGAVTLSWQPGQQVHTYNIYRMFPAVNQQYQLLKSITATSYTDTSSLAIKNARQSPGIIYAIFAVGPTGVENPSDEVITVMQN
jgi:hypothetical protein